MNRINDCHTIDDVAVAEAVERGEEIVIQYSKPIYSPQLLMQLDELCRRHGDRIEIRFYGHYSEGFDFRTLDRLPNVQRLAVDCLRDVSNLEALFELPALRHLTFGAYSEIPADFLAHPNLGALRSLTLGEAKRPSIDLSPIADFSLLERLNLVSHYRKIDSVGALQNLRWLTLSQIKKGVRLGFVSRLASLQTLRLILGGRDQIHEVTHPALEHLEIIRVRGLSEFRPDDFPGLKFLQIEDQIRLPALRFGSGSQFLTELRLLNCKTLSTLSGLGHLSALAGLRIYHTAISFGDLVRSGLPAALKVFAFYTSKTSLDLPIRQKLDALGYAESGPQQRLRFW